MSAHAQLLGTGAGKADPERFSPSNVVWLGSEPVLVDCGNGAAWNSFEPGRPVYDWHEIAPPAVGQEFDGELVVGEDLMKIEL